ncbi:TPA: hypothetical protein MCG72_004008 [Klebsiella pneumoniae]|nr:hypothetical protein [Klebsiella pneumoniae]HBT7053333.1 hypothetical protein [Klebsiella pneumoniae]
MDSANLTTVATLLVALIVGLLAYASTSSSKEKEVKLSVYEKLGIEAHEALESIQNNTEYLIQVFLFQANVTRKSIKEAHDKVLPNIDKLRELRVRLMFFDKDVFDQYENVLNSHGSILPEIFGYGNHNGNEPLRVDRKFTNYEKRIYIFKLRQILKLTEDTKSLLISETSKRYQKTISSSKWLNFIIFPLIIACFLIMGFLSLKAAEKKSPEQPTNIIIIRN